MCTPREPLGGCEGRGPAKGPQEAEKAPEKQLASLLHYVKPTPESIIGNISGLEIQESGAEEK